MTPLIFHAIDFSAREVGSGLAVRPDQHSRAFVAVHCSIAYPLPWPIRAQRCWPLPPSDPAAGRQLQLPGGTTASGCAGAVLASHRSGSLELRQPALGQGCRCAQCRCPRIGIGTLIGTAAPPGTWTVYIVEAVAGAVLVLISLVPLGTVTIATSATPSAGWSTPTANKQAAWLLPLLPVLLIGGGHRNPGPSTSAPSIWCAAIDAAGLSESHGGALIALQLLVSLQWPVGRCGGAERCLRPRLEPGGIQPGLQPDCPILLVQQRNYPGAGSPAANGLRPDAFLPTATEAVVEEAPPEHRGLAMALFSNCCHWRHRGATRWWSTARP